MKKAWCFQEVYHTDYLICRMISGISESEPWHQEFIIKQPDVMEALQLLALMTDS